LGSEVDATVVRFRYPSKGCGITEEQLILFPEIVRERFACGEVAAMRMRKARSEVALRVNGKSVKDLD
jgi:hypothetical protein